MARTRLYACPHSTRKLGRNESCWYSSQDSGPEKSRRFGQRQHQQFLQLGRRTNFAVWPSSSWPGGSTAGGAWVAATQASSWTSASRVEPNADHRPGHGADHRPSHVTPMIDNLQCARLDLGP
eukprot:1933950-Pleurochrysis_carterae.AAC.2